VIRFHLDEHVPRALAEGLRRRGLDVTTTSEAELFAADDEAQLEFARSNRRVLVTFDADFLRLNDQGVEHHGIVFCTRRRRSRGELLRTLVLVAQQLSPEEMKNHVEYV